MIDIPEGYADVTDQFMSKEKSKEKEETRKKEEANSSPESDLEKSYKETGEVSCNFFLCCTPISGRFGTFVSL